MCCLSTEKWGYGMVWIWVPRPMPWTWRNLGDENLLNHGISIYQSKKSWLVVWNMTFIFPYIGNNHHPNWLIFFRGVGQLPTRRGFTKGSMVTWRSLKVEPTSLGSDRVEEYRLYFSVFRRMVGLRGILNQYRSQLIGLPSGKLT